MRCRQRKKLFSKALRNQVNDNLVVPAKQSVSQDFTNIYVVLDWGHASPSTTNIRNHASPLSRGE